MDDHIDIPLSFWERLASDKRKLALVVGGALLTVALIVAAALGLSARNAPPPVPRDSSGNSTKPPTSVDEPTTEPTDSVEPSQPVPSVNTTASDTPTGSASFARKPFIAYRLSGALWISREDGTSPRQLFEVARGAFALSPDAGTLACVDAGKSLLTLVDVASGTSKSVGPAEDADMCWSPDSGFVLYTAKTANRFDIRRVLRDGTGSANVAAGHSPRVSPSGSGVAWIADSVFGQAGTASAALFKDAARVSRFSGPSSTEVAFAVDGVVLVVGGAPGTARVLTMPLGSDLAFNSAKAREIVGSPSGSRPVSYAHLCASPSPVDGSGRYLAYAEVGDDGYSRTFIYDATKSRSVALSVRRDTYPLCWSADGKRLFMVEGNAFQGESTVLVSVLPDGMGRKAIVHDAGQ
ncbi:MAG: DUF350 domain-containing protein [Actinobacteria bacterium]|nr:DUF350 domain-containing protein [Actinomycetota bacterium]MCG2807157.1 DUF350 domain-containing protein [Coriobacteriia bacterium]